MKGVLITQEATYQFEVGGEQAQVINLGRYLDDLGGALVLFEGRRPVATIDISQDGLNILHGQEVPVEEELENLALGFIQAQG